MEEPDAEGLRRHSLWFSRLTFFLFVATFLLVVLSVALAIRGRGPDPQVLVRNAVLWLPACFYLYALWGVHGIFRSFARGGLLGSSIERGCRRAGWALAVGGGLSAVGVPNLMRILADLGAVERSGWMGVLVFDIAYLAVGVVGLALILLGRLLRLAGDAQLEANRLRDELGGFF